MTVENSEKLPPLPGVIGSLRAGFDIVSSRVWLILLPFAFDVFLWLGPRLSAGKLSSSIFASMLDALKDRPLPEAETQAVGAFFEMIGRMNWLSFARTFPVGISSLESFAIPETIAQSTPLGAQSVLEMGSFLSLLGWVCLLTIVGWVGGSLYFRSVSLATLGRDEAGITVGRAFFQTALLSVFLTVGFSIALFPISLIVGAAGLFSPALSTAIMFIIALLSYWLIIPLFFTPHGIFVKRENAVRSMYSSLRVSRFTFPTSGLFVLTLFVVTSGLNYLWIVPKNDTWMKLVGIFGHAFISTMLLSASFAYYRNINIWLQTVLEKMQQKQNMPTQRA
jgi:hypothetical protein